ncbi:UDP-glucose 4-epimerase GalE [Pseudoduganella albidiflava]|uniref:UDP-glucose 4-epimerase n=1 Tax=Pseudoduganella albidiflava TaxID=321983 RepID=A0A411X206_9BURK|nr:UDP-glucose 4-epimerase GalE [Pseudoduganella albidiflava]QBI03007.1 UDP-glucose 4-epimerase GalE [Pseudoduganella albidiflava]GGY58182.1 UDP-glucose 4-epimerase [Pseudoduganella albidiflava]
MKILVTGGMGYIGSHTVVELAHAGHEVVVLDNLANASRAVQERVQRITGKPFEFIEADIRDRAALEGVFATRQFDSVIHFAGLKAVGESVAQPLRYYDNNVSGSVALLETMAKFNVKSIVFSSSATVYGDPATVPITEDFPLSATNPYGRSKLMIEEILRDLHKSDNSWRIALLRYFNPVGAHESGLIGEEPSGIPNNLMPYVAQVAEGKREFLSVFGGDYPTPDGTGVRDYIHVVDLAIGHVKTLDKLATGPGVYTYNLGTGRGNSVLEMVRAFEAASGRQVPYKIVDRRPGDIAACYADTATAERELGWKAQFDIARMCIDTWRWQSSSR